MRKKCIKTQINPKIIQHEHGFSINSSLKKTYFMTMSRPKENMWFSGHKEIHYSPFVPIPQNIRNEIIFLNA